MPSRKYEGMFINTSRFSPGTRGCLERSIAVALKGRKSGSVPLRRAVEEAARELRSQGLDLAATLSFLGGVVEDAGRVCGADRPSLFSREPLWLSVQSFVLAAVTTESQKLAVVAA
ncbi:MAG TPA: hypothetical protein VIV65_03255, partial [Gemmatimonadaceae bacterium]